MTTYKPTQTGLVYGPNLGGYQTYQVFTPDPDRYPPPWRVAAFPQNLGWASSQNFIDIPPGGAPVGLPGAVWGNLPWLLLESGIAIADGRTTLIDVGLPGRGTKKHPIDHPAEHAAHQFSNKDACIFVQHLQLNAQFLQLTGKPLVLGNSAGGEASLYSTLSIDRNGRPGYYSGASTRAAGAIVQITQTNWPAFRRYFFDGSNFVLALCFPVGNDFSSSCAVLQQADIRDLRAFSACDYGFNDADYPGVSALNANARLHLSGLASLVNKNPGSENFDETAELRWIEDEIEDIHDWWQEAALVRKLRRTHFQQARLSRFVLVAAGGPTGFGENAVLASAQALALDQWAFALDVLGGPAQLKVSDPFVELVERYGQQGGKLLPAGIAWNRRKASTTTALFEGLGAELARVQRRGEDLVRESDPRTTNELLPEWERYLGLPGSCEQLAPTAEGRAAAVVTKYTAQGSMTLGYYVELAKKLGWAFTHKTTAKSGAARAGDPCATHSKESLIEIEEYAPFVAGSFAGELLSNGDWPWAWKVHAPPHVPQFATAGRARAGQKLVASDNTLLECVFKDLKPAHSEVLFDYDLSMPPEAYGPWPVIELGAVKLNLRPRPLQVVEA